MNTITKIATLFIALTITIFSYADEDHHKHHGTTPGHSLGHSEEESHAAGKQETIEGRLIGLTCFIKHGATGPSHKKCAQECAEKGLPLGIMTDAGIIYQVSASGHGSLVEANSKLLKYAEEKVVVVGETFSKNGMNMIVISKIKGN